MPAASQICSRAVVSRYNLLYLTILFFLKSIGYSYSRRCLFLTFFYSGLLYKFSILQNSQDIIFYLTFSIFSFGHINWPFTFGIPGPRYHIAKKPKGIIIVYIFYIFTKPFIQGLAFSLAYIFTPLGYI